MNRLYLRIWIAFLGILAVFAVLVATLWWLLPHERPGLRFAQGARVLLERGLPPATAPRADLQRVVQTLADRLESDITVHGPDGAVLASVGRPMPPPPPEYRPPPGLDAPSPGAPPPPGFGPPAPGEPRRIGPAFVITLGDGRTVSMHPRHRFPIEVPLAALAVLLVTTAIGAYFLVRRITRRLERLRSRVEALGSGDLSARVDVEGRDEVAQLAESFNQAAGRIEQLVRAQKALLANVSHELRTPLTRMRMSLELLATEVQPQLASRMQREIAELDALVGELLESSRLDTGVATEPAEAVDLLGLAAEVAAEYGADVAGRSVLLDGEPRALRRLVRNLLENARRYAGGQPAEITVDALSGGGGSIVVADRGPGVPEHERERIFEPFHRMRGASETGEGVGLGLALVRQIARRHGGDVICLPREGGGTEFRVTLAGH